ncbi:MAG: hypothetical protein V3T83_03770 [Acidobacteriota bacterium]
MTNALLLSCWLAASVLAAPCLAAQEDSKSGRAALQTAIEKALSDPSSRGGMRLFTECLSDSGMRSLAVYGDGTGIWDSRLQFQLTPQHISTLLESLKQADFAAMPEVYGGPEQKDVKAPPKNGGEKFVIRVTCRVELTLGGESKQVVQRVKGKQSKQFKKLADSFFQLCEPLAQKGIAASSLSDGLSKLARRELKPHSWQLMMHRKPDERSAIQGNIGFLLRIAGGTVTSRQYDPASGYTDPLKLKLTQSDLENLAKRLAELDPEGLPGNLYASDYTDLNIRLLNHRTSVQARQFSGMTAATHGQRQKNFDAIYEALYQLHLRVVNEGKRD